MAKTADPTQDLFAMGKQFWDTWTGFAQGATSGQTPSWGEPLGVFAQAVPRAADEARHSVESMAEQGRQFFEFLQAAAARMGVGEPLDARAVSELWRRGMADGNPLLDALRAVGAEGARGFEQMDRDLQPWLAQLRSGVDAALGSPAFGYHRERQGQWQELLKAQGAHQEANNRYNVLLAKAGRRGMEYFENKLAERSEPGRQIDSARALYDLWVDAAEEAYAEVALSPEFRSAYAEMVNTQMRLRRCMQREIEHHAGSLGLPTRSELDGAHRKIHDLQRELRSLKQAIAGLGASVPVVATTSPAAPPADAQAEAPAETAATAAPRAKAAAKAPGKQGKTAAQEASSKPTRGGRAASKTPRSGKEA